MVYWNDWLGYGDGRKGIQPKEVPFMRHFPKLTYVLSDYSRPLWLCFISMLYPLRYASFSSSAGVYPITPSH